MKHLIRNISDIPKSKIKDTLYSIPHYDFTNGTLSLSEVIAYNTIVIMEYYGYDLYDKCLDESNVGLFVTMHTLCNLVDTYGMNLKIIDSRIDNVNKTVMDNGRFRSNRKVVVDVIDNQYTTIAESSIESPLSYLIDSDIDYFNKNFIELVENNLNYDMEPLLSIMKQEFYTNTVDRTVPENHERIIMVDDVLSEESIEELSNVCNFSTQYRWFYSPEIEKACMFTIQGKEKNIFNIFEKCYEVEFKTDFVGELKPYSCLPLRNLVQNLDIDEKAHIVPINSMKDIHRYNLQHQEGIFDSNNVVMVSYQFLKDEWED